MAAQVAQKTAQSSKPKKASKPSHPPFKQMIIEAIKQLNEPNGLSRKVIRKCIEDKYAPKHMSTFLNKNLAKMIDSGKLKHPKKCPGKYVINVVKAETKPRKTQKKKVARKPKTVKKPTKKVTARKKKPKSPAKKQKVKAAKKSPVKKAGPKKVKGPPSPKKSAPKGKKGRGRQKKK